MTTPSRGELREVEECLELSSHRMNTMATLLRSSGHRDLGGKHRFVCKPLQTNMDGWSRKQRWGLLFLTGIPEFLVRYETTHGLRIYLSLWYPFICYLTLYYCMYVGFSFSSLICSLGSFSCCLSSSLKGDYIFSFRFWLICTSASLPSLLIDRFLYYSCIHYLIVRISFACNSIIRLLSKFLVRLLLKPSSHITTLHSMIPGCRHRGSAELQVFGVAGVD